MIVIVEGMERTGKTTLARYLEKQGYLYLKDRVHTNNYSLEAIKSRQDAFINILTELDSKNVNVVVDRFHLSEYAYASVNRRRSPDELSYLLYEDVLLSKMNVALFYMVRNDDKDGKNTLIESHESEYDKIREKMQYLFEKSEIRIKKKINLKSQEYNFKKICADLQFKSKEEKPLFDFYLASPFFNEAQKDRENIVKKILRSAGYTVYSPMEHGIVSADDKETIISDIFQSNIVAIQKCKMIIAITDEKDMGTIWEAGYAYGINKPIVYYCETLGNNPFNIMLSESGIGIIKSRDMLYDCAELDNFKTGKDVKHE